MVLAGAKYVEENRHLKHRFWGGRFYILSHSYKFSHGLCLNNFFQILLKGNERDQVPSFRYINRYDEVSHLVIVSKVLGDMQYLMRSVKRSARAILIWTEDYWDVKRVNSIRTKVSGRFTLKINNRLDSLS